MNDDFCLKMGNNIKKFRKEQQMTLKELANKVGLTEATIQKYEAGNIKRVDIVMLAKIADALNVPPEEIPGWKTNKRLEPNQGQQEAILIKKYSQLTNENKQTVHSLIESLLENQAKYNSDK